MTQLTFDGGPPPQPSPNPMVDRHGAAGHGRICRACLYLETSDRDTIDSVCRCQVSDDPEAWTWRDYWPACRLFDSFIPLPDDQEESA